MEYIDGVDIKKLDFELTKMGDLLFHEGPLLSHFKDLTNQNHYLFKWADHDETRNRWLVCKVNPSALKRFLEGKTTLENLLKNPSNNFIYIIHTADNFKVESVLITSTTAIPTKYWPNKDSWIDDFHYEDYALELKNALKKQQSPTKTILGLIKQLPSSQIAQLEADLLLKINQLGLG